MHLDKNFHFFYPPFFGSVMRIEKDIQPIALNQTTAIHNLYGSVAVIAGNNHFGAERNLFIGRHKHIPLPNAVTIGRNTVCMLPAADFARAVRRWQKAIGTAIKLPMYVNMLLAGIDPMDVNLSISFPPIGTIDEITILKADQVRAEIAKTLERGKVNEGRRAYDNLGAPVQASIKQAVKNVEESGLLTGQEAQEMGFMIAKVLSEHGGQKC